jgi:large subunit ribosomal protein L16
MFNPPNIQKFKKKHRFSIHGLFFKNKLMLGFYGLKAVEYGYLNFRQIEAARKAIIKQIKKHAKLYILIKPNLAITSKPAEVRMGKGKGNIVDWVYVVKPGKILFEVKILDHEQLSEDKIKNVFQLGSNKLPIKTKFVK